MALATWFTPKITVMGRGYGHSVVAKAAYRAGLSLYDERLGITFDFTYKHDVERTELIGFKGTKTDIKNRVAELWSMAERAEKTNPRARTAREMMVPLSSDWTKEQQQAFGMELGNKIHDEFGVAVQVSFHNSKDGKNPHVHIMWTVRKVENDIFKDKTIEFETKYLNQYEIDRGLTKTGDEVIAGLRNDTAALMNKYAKEYGNDWFVTGGKFAEHLGEDYIPMRPLGKKGSYNSLVDRVYPDNLAFNNDVRTYRLLSKELDQVKQEIILRLAQDADVHQKRRAEHYQVIELQAPTKAQLKAQEANTKTREALAKAEKEDEEKATAEIVNKVQKEMQDAEWEYQEVLNNRADLINIFEAIKARTSVGNLTDFWDEPPLTLGEKFNSTKEEIDKLDKRELYLRELLNSNVNRRFSTLDNTPPTVITKPTEAIQPVPAPVAPVDIAELTLALNAPTTEEDDKGWTQEQIDAAIAAGIETRDKKQAIEDAESIVAQSLGMTLAEYRKSHANQQQQHTDYSVGLTDEPTQEQKNEDEHSIK